MNTQAWFNFALAALGVLATIYSIRAARKGKEADNAQQALATTSASEQSDRALRFSEITRSLEEARRDLEYYQLELKKSRQAAAELDAKLDRIQAAWVARHRALLERCEEMSDIVAEAMKNPGIRPEARAKVAAAVNKTRAHIRSDHAGIE